MNDHLNAITTHTRTSSAAARVVIEGDCLLVDRLRSYDPDVVAAARFAQTAGTPPADWAAAALAVGARAIALAGPVAGVDAVSRRIDRLADQVTAAADASAASIRQAVLAAADPATGTLAVAVRTALDRLAADVTATVAGEDAPLRLAVDRGLRDATGAAAERVERALATSSQAIALHLSPSDPAGPVAALRAEVRQAGADTRRELGEQLGEVRTLLAVARERAAVMTKASIKGIAYEDAVLDAVQELCAAAGDTLAGTGTETGLVAKAKTGDAVVTISPTADGGTGALLVVEAKDTRLSSERWRKELDAGMRNRRAHAGMGVVRSPDAMPGGRRRLLVIDPQRVVVAWDPDSDPDDVLAAAYVIARAGAASAAAAGSGSGADQAALAQAVADAHAALTGFDAVERAAGTARRSVDDLAKAAEALRAVLHGHLVRGLRLAKVAA